jgi:hypothetical protein
MGFVDHGTLTQTLQEGGVIHDSGGSITIWKDSPLGDKEPWYAGTVHPSTFRRMRESGAIKLLEVGTGWAKYVYARGDDIKCPRKSR